VIQEGIPTRETTNGGAANAGWAPACWGSVDPKSPESGMLHPVASSTYILRITVLRGDIDIVRDTGTQGLCKLSTTAPASNTLMGTSHKMKVAPTIDKVSIKLGQFNYKLFDEI
jgi:hypothetical protein